MGRQPGESRRPALEHVDERREWRRAGEWQALGRHLVEHDAEREEIASRIERILTNAFGRHVVRGTQRPAGDGRSVERRRREIGEADAPGQSEIEHLHVAGPADEDVARLDVPVDDAARVRGGERSRDRRADVDDPRRVERLPKHEPLQIHPVEQFHHDERTLSVLANLEDRADVRMLQLRDDLRLAPEPTHGVRISGGFVRQQFDGDVPWPCQVLGLVDHAHAAAPDGLDQPVMRDLFAVHG